MHQAKSFMSFVSVLIMCGTVGMGNPMESQAVHLDKNLNKRCPEVPPWRGVIPGNERFVPTFVEGNTVHAYCDRQTGLVWDASPDVDIRTWTEARFHCSNTRTWLGQKGGRLPSMPELASLVDTTSTLCTGGGPCLPNGHPFNNVQSARYWSASTWDNNTIRAWDVNFLNGIVNTSAKAASMGRAWCVRGAMNAHVY